MKSYAIWMAVNDLSATDIIAIIGAVGVMITTTATAITTAIIAVRTGQIRTTGEQTQKTGEQTHDMVNGHSEDMKALIQKQAEEMYQGGLSPTVDDSVKKSSRS